MALRWTLGLMTLSLLAAADLTSYLQRREDDALMCLYTFDNPSLDSQVPNCPFGSLVPTPGLVAPLGDDQVGYRWNPSDAIDMVQLQSTDVVESRAFYEPALGKRGVTFEMVFRLYKPAASNVNVNLFAISSPYDDCSNPGFRVEVSDRHLLVLIFYVLKPDNSVQVCFEQHFYSMMEKRGFRPCQIPFGASPRNGDNPPPPIVHFLISINPNDPTRGAWTTIFQVTYYEADGSIRECIAYNSMEGVRGFADLRVFGNYKLYIGNNGRRVKHRVPRKVPYVAPPSPPGPTVTPREVTMLDNLGNYLYMALPQLDGLFLAFNGKKVVEISPKGISFGDAGRVYNVGDIGRWIKSALSKLKDSAALRLRKTEIYAQLDAMAAANKPPPPTPQASVDWSKTPLHARYPLPNASIDMDVFLFAIASKVFLVNRLIEVPAIELPHMGTNNRKRTITMMQDTSVTIPLRAFTLNRRTSPPLVITQWPEFGTLTQCASSGVGEKVVASMVLNDGCVVYTPPAKRSNTNIPGGNPYLVERRAAQPFATLGYAVAGTKAAAATVHFFVTAAPLSGSGPTPLVASNSTVKKKSSPSIANLPPTTMTTAVLVAPPYQYNVRTRDNGKVTLSLRLHSVRPLHPKVMLRVTLKSGMEAKVAITSDPLRNASRAAHCGMQLKFGEVCWARDSNSSGIEYELTGLWLSSAQVTFRGEWAQVQNALTDLVVIDSVRYPHVTKLKLKIESLTPTLATFPVVKRTISIQFAPPMTTTTMTNVMSLSSSSVEGGVEEADCTPLFFVLPGVCEESFGGRSGIWGSIFTALVVAWVFGMWQERTAAGRAAALAQRTVQNASEFNAIVQQFKGVIQEPNMHAAMALLSLCETRHETLIAMAGVTLVLTESQTMPRFWSLLLSKQGTHEQIEYDKMEDMMRWYCRLIGRGWINGVLDAAVAKVTSCNMTHEGDLWAVVETTMRLHLATVPVEIALLSTLGPTRTFGFVDHFLRPSLQAAVPQLPLALQATMASHVDDVVWMEPMASVVLQQGFDTSYTPTPTPLSGGCHELMPHALLHLLCLVKRYEEGMVALCLHQDQDDVPPVGVRLEQIIEALGITKQNYTDLVGLTQCTTMAVE
ncbi:hypothetical protein DYB37_006762 [Aphanomyces astaci]|uniref:Uncharacterized protein n=1 Tax=Aphanomyces astaci TaxID=112090 RepID=A0A418E7N5_APHAT|nr:hypothetical protein DYB37_006762 [Aphanomyces astaci]